LILELDRGEGILGKGISSWLKKSSRMALEESSFKT
jgi:hypothetical protein